MSNHPAILHSIQTGIPQIGPDTVHIDLTNACNAACTTCWDHSPHLKNPRPPTWKKQRLDYPTFEHITTDLASMNSVRHIILSGMGEPLINPAVYQMIRQCKAYGWHVTLITNLIAADIDQLIQARPDQLLVGVQGVTPDTYAAFHPGWNETHFFTLCRYLRRLQSTPIRARHVQVINRDTAPELVEMIRFAKNFGAERVNYKLASLGGPESQGTEACAITDPQRTWLQETALPEARALAHSLNVMTNLNVFENQLSSGGRATAPIHTIGCAMGYLYTRITVTGDILYCCNTQVKVGHISETPVSALWWGPRWQKLRDALRAGHYFAGCDQCGKIEQNKKWMERAQS